MCKLRVMGKDEIRALNMQSAVMVISASYKLGKRFVDAINDGDLVMPREENQGDRYVLRTTKHADHWYTDGNGLYLMCFAFADREFVRAYRLAEDNPSDANIKVELVRRSDGAEDTVYVGSALWLMSDLMDELQYRCQQGHRKLEDYSIVAIDTAVGLEISRINGWEA